MSRIRRILHRGKEILITDYSDSNESKMIETLDELRQIIERENKRVLLLSIFNNNDFITPRFMRHAEKDFKSVRHLVIKQAMTGLSETKKMILKGFNLLFNRNIKNFNTIEEALTFLVDDATSDRVEKD